MARDFSIIFKGFDKSIEIYRKNKITKGIEDELKMLNALQTDFIESLTQVEKSEPETKSNLDSFKRIEKELKNLQKI